MAHHVADFIRALQPVDTCAHRGLQAVRITRAPAAAPPPPALALSPLTTAVQTGAAQVTEVGDGSVGELEVKNRSGALLFGMTGELVVGGRQDRVLNSSVLIAPGTAARVAVSCVEQHRWESRGTRRPFQTANATASSSVRSVVHRTMVTSVRQTGVHRADQQQVWQKVSDTLRRTGTHRATRTGALTHGLAHDAARLEGYAQACAQPVNVVTPVPGGRGTVSCPQLGLALFTPGTPSAGMHGFTSLDCFGAPELLTHYASRLVRGAALEALADGAPAPMVAPPDATRLLLEALADHEPVVSRPAAGEAPGAQELHYVFNGIVASVLCHQGRPIHVAVTPLEEPAIALRILPGTESRLPGERALLRIQIHNGSSRVLQLPPGSYILGRSSTCDIGIVEDGVSRTHAQLVLAADGTATLRDLDSTNGVTVNDEPVVFAQLKHGDRIGLGRNVKAWLMRTV